MKHHPAATAFGAMLIALPGFAVSGLALWVLGTLGRWEWSGALLAIVILFIPAIVMTAGALVFVYGRHPGLVWRDRPLRVTFVAVLFGVIVGCVGRCSAMSLDSKAISKDEIVAVVVAFVCIAAAKALLDHLAEWARTSWLPTATSFGILGAGVALYPSANVFLESRFLDRLDPEGLSRASNVPPATLLSAASESVFLGVLVGFAFAALVHALPRGTVILRGLSRTIGGLTLFVLVPLLVRALCDRSPQVFLGSHLGPVRVPQAWIALGITALILAAALLIASFVVDIMRLRRARRRENKLAPTYRTPAPVDDQPRVRWRSVLLQKRSLPLESFAVALLVFGLMPLVAAAQAGVLTESDAVSTARARWPNLSESGSPGPRRLKPWLTKGAAEP